MKQNYRSNGPPTSARAGRTIEASGTARQQRTRCLDAVLEAPGLTAQEIEARIGIKAHKRLPELREAGDVYNGSPRTCTVTGRQALTWEPALHHVVVARHQRQSQVQSTLYTGAHA